MKHVAILMLLFVGGCTSLAMQDAQKFFDRFKVQNPTATVEVIDEDNDGQADTAVYTDASGEEKEVEGAREHFDAVKEAEGDDELISSELQAWAAVLGLPIVGLVGRVWGRHKPMLCANLLAHHRLHAPLF